MNTNDLETVQVELDRLGLRDVKFFFTELNSKLNSAVRDEVAYVLSTHLRGDSVTLEPFGDLKPRM
ncbi:MAG: hypothetical protein KBA82_04320 [Nitrosomonas sp.]|nr:hypothetical protein [Nitrosomonas sp.]MBP7112193.1 hypothetical protein [Nitrosomonas sp.]